MFDVPQPKIKANYYNFKIMLQSSRFISMQAKVNCWSCIFLGQPEYAMFISKMLHSCSLNQIKYTYSFK